MVFVVVYQYVRELPSVAALMAAVAIAFAVLGLLAPRLGDRVTVNSFAVLLLLTVGAISFVRGGFRPVVLLFAAFIPVGSIFFAPNRRGPWFWSVLLIVEFVTLALLDTFDLVPSSAPPHPLSDLVATLGVVAIFLYLARTIVRSWTATERERKGLERRIRDAERLESLGRLAGGVAHDFNNLLTVIRSHAELAAADPDDTESLPADLEAILSAADRGASLSRDLLAFGRREPVSLAPVRIGLLVERVGSLMKRLLRDDVELDTSGVATGAVASIDEAQIEQAVVNLCLNAQDAMRGGGRIRLTTQTVDVVEPRPTHHSILVPGGYVAVSVSDDGDGIEPEVLAHAFDPFYTTKARGEGSGLGLSSVDGVVSQHGGAVDVETVVGGGTTFTLYLPRAVGATATAEVSEVRAPSSSAAPRQIVLVEDEEDVRHALSSLLKRAGHRVSAHEEGTAALRWLAQHDPPDLLLTDVLMPGLSGPQMAERARQEQPELPVLFLSGHVDEELGRDRLDGKRTHYLAKPVSRADLLSAVERLTS